MNLPLGEYPIVVDSLITDPMVNDEVLVVVHKEVLMEVSQMVVAYHN